MNNLFKWLIARVLDKLKASDPKTLLFIVMLAVGAEASLAYGLANDIIPAGTIWQTLSVILASVIALGAGLTGSRTTRYVKESELHEGKKMLAAYVQREKIVPSEEFFKTKVLFTTQLGIDNIKVILYDFVLVTMKVRDILRGFSFRDILSKLDEMLELFFLIQDARPNLSLAKIAWQEFKDLDETEALAVTDHLKALYEDEDEDLEQIVEEGFDLIPKVHAVVLFLFETARKSKGLWTDVVTYFRKAFARNGAITE